MSDGDRGMAAVGAETGEWLARYHKERTNAIQSEVEELYGKLTERERRLMREAAVASWVAAVRHYRLWDVTIPKDAGILNSALWVCHGSQDLYPIFTEYHLQQEDEEELEEGEV